MSRDSWVNVRRQWNDWRIGSVRLSRIRDLHWDSFSGGVWAPTPQPFVHGYVDCDQVDGEIAHSCGHGEGPHSIKVCVVKKDNDLKVWQKILEISGPKPGKTGKRR